MRANLRFMRMSTYCFNARRAGWQVWYVPTSRIVHLVGQSTGITVKTPKRQPGYSFEARRRYFFNYYGPVLCGD